MISNGISRREGAKYVAAARTSPMRNTLVWA